MNDQGISRESVHHHYHGGWCCGLIGKSGAVFCGLALICIGTFWLLGNVGLIPDDWWEIAIPILFIVWGVATFLRVGRGDGSAHPL